MDRLAGAEGVVERLVLGDDVRVRALEGIDPDRDVRAVEQRVRLEEAKGKAVGPHDELRSRQQGLQPIFRLRGALSRYQPPTARRGPRKHAEGEREETAAQCACHTPDSSACPWTLGRGGLSLVWM